MVHKTEEECKSLLSKPGNEKSQVYERNQAQYNDCSEGYISIRNDFSKQFAHIYAARLAELRDVLIPRVNAKWGNVTIAKLADLETLEGQRCVIIGTLYKHQQWKPSILRELSEDHQLTPTCARSDYCSDKDIPYLEDEMLRIKLAGNQVDLRTIVTGIVCAIVGREETNGTFMVEDWCFPGCVPKQALTTVASKGKLVLVSGLDLANNTESLAVGLLSEWLCGLAGNMAMQKDATSIIRVIIAGNTVKSETKTNTHMGHTEGKTQDNATAMEIAAATQAVDKFLSELAKCCCLTLMPGEHDPTNIMLPQRPMHPCLLPKTSRYESFKGATNPWIGKIEERVIVGNSGQPIKDIIKATGETGISPIEWLEKTLLWRNICPTAPDTLMAYPSYKKDLFIMRECPDIYFVGNMDKFDTKLWKGEENQIVRLVSVPQFSTTQTAVIVNLENLDTEYVSFGSG